MIGIVHLGPRLLVNCSPLSPIAPLYPSPPNSQPFLDFPEPNVHLIRAHHKPPSQYTRQYCCMQSDLRNHFDFRQFCIEYSIVYTQIEITKRYPTVHETTVFEIPFWFISISKYNNLKQNMKFSIPFVFSLTTELQNFSIIRRNLHYSRFKKV